jgi:hypothetical protein
MRVDRLDDCPCKNCTTETGRCVGCHANCQGYLEWRKIKDSYNRLERDAKKFSTYRTHFNY